MQKGDTINVILATGPLVAVTKVPVSLGVKFSDSHSIECWLFLDLDSRYDFMFI